MMQKFAVFFAVVVLFNITNALAQNAPLTNCDSLAADPDDPQNKSYGVSIDNIDSRIQLASA
jgi:hypothetical protein